MRHYAIYLIEEEIVEYYVGQEYKLFQLFKEYEQNSRIQPIIKKQIDYITKRIPTHSLNQLIRNSLYHKKEYDFKDYEHSLWLLKGKSKATLNVYENYLELIATGSFEAESTFFEVIRKNGPYYLAIDIKAERYGWLQPIKQRKFV